MAKHRRAIRFSCVLVCARYCGTHSVMSLNVCFTLLLSLYAFNNSSIWCTFIKDNFTLYKLHQWRRHIKQFSFTLPAYRICIARNIHLKSNLIDIFYSTFQDDHKAFRRQLEDKRPVVENNLLSGKQYVASEPPISDTSDTEGTLHLLYLVIQWYVSICDMALFHTNTIPFNFPNCV